MATIDMEKITVKRLIEELQKYNENAEFEVVIDCMPAVFAVTAGYKLGKKYSGDLKKCDQVTFEITMHQFEE